MDGERPAADGPVGDEQKHLWESRLAVSFYNPADLAAFSLQSSSTEMD